MTRGAVRRWVADSGSTPARFARRGARAALRLRARLRSGSVSAEMDRIVAEANSGEYRSGLGLDLLERSRDLRRRARP